MRQELVMRYEPPDQRNRWDKPLWRIDVASTLDPAIWKSSMGNKTNSNEGEKSSAEHILEQSVYNMHSLRDAITDESQSTAATSKTKKKSSFKRAGGGASARFRRPQQCQSDQGGSTTEKEEQEELKPPAQDQQTTTSSTSTHATTTKTPQSPKPQSMNELIDSLLDAFLLDVQPLQEGYSTKLQSSAPPNVLHDIDAISKQCMNAFFTAQKVQLPPGGGGGTVQVPLKDGTVIRMALKRSVSVVEMKQWRRQYIRWVATNPPSDTTEVGISTSWLSYIQNNV